MSLHICVGTNTRYIGQVRLPGHRLWNTAGPERKTRAAAARDMLRKFLKGDYKRGRVIMTADYYDPVVVLRMEKP